MPDLTMPVPKTVTQSRTNQTVAAIVTVVAAKFLARYLPADIAAQVAGVLTDEVVSVVVAGLGSLAVYFRQKANPQPGPIDQQNVVTPRP